MNLITAAVAESLDADGPAMAAIGNPTADRDDELDKGADESPAKCVCGAESRVQSS